MSKNTQSTSTQSETTVMLARFVAEVKDQLDFARDEQKAALSKVDYSPLPGDVLISSVNLKKALGLGGQVVALDWILWKLERLGLATPGIRGGGLD